VFFQCEHMFGGAKGLRVVFFQCDWFDQINDSIAGRPRGAQGPRGGSQKAGGVII
jgi:hypothetical protein